MQNKITNPVIIHLNYGSISDDQFKPDVGKQLFERYVKRDKVDFLTGVVFSNIMLAGLPEAISAIAPS